jgi:hypothetical protein
MYVHKPQHISSRSTPLSPCNFFIALSILHVSGYLRGHESWADWDTPKQITSYQAKFEEAKQWFNASGRNGRPQFALIYLDDQGATRVIKDFNNSEIQSHVNVALRELKYLSPFPPTGTTVIFLFFSNFRLNAV